MKFKFKVDEGTTLEGVRDILDSLKKADIKEIPLNYLIRIIEYLGGKRIVATGSVVRFMHPLLNNYPQYHGYFTVHKIHKGGDQEEIRMVDFKKYLLPALLIIIEEKKHYEQQKNK